MRVLLDTHIAIWAAMGAEALPQRARDILLDESNDIFYSTASVWEVVIKHMLRPNDMILDGKLFEAGCEDNGFHVIPILNKHTFVVETLKRSEDAPRHNDPFDRILLAQAKVEGMQFLTHDSMIPYYNEPFVISV